MVQTWASFISRSAAWAVRRAKRRTDHGTHQDSGTTNEDEDPAFWATHPHDDLAKRCAALHAESRRAYQERLDAEIRGARAGMATVFVHGTGIEVGAGTRPWPVPQGVTILYGDIRNDAELQRYFDKAGSPGVDRTIDAQTYAGVADESCDFVLSAHVIEHLFDPLGSIAAAMRTLKPNGVHLIAAPDMRFTFDCKRPETTVEHILRDFEDGGESTRLQAYEEHCRFVHPTWSPPIPEHQIPARARQICEGGMDVHVHAWTYDGFAAMLAAGAGLIGFRVEAGMTVVNESIFALRKMKN